MFNNEKCLHVLVIVFIHLSIYLSGLGTFPKAFLQGRLPKWQFPNWAFPKFEISQVARMGMGAERRG